MDLWGLLFRALGPSECFGLKGFTSRWLLRVIGLPAIMAAICVLYYCYDSRKSSKYMATTNLKSHVRSFYMIERCYTLLSLTLQHYSATAVHSYIL